MSAGLADVVRFLSVALLVLTLCVTLVVSLVAFVTIVLVVLVTAATFSGFSMTVAGSGTFLVEAATAYEAAAADATTAFTVLFAAVTGASVDVGLLETDCAP